MCLGSRDCYSELVAFEWEIIVNSFAVCRVLVTPHCIIIV